MLVFVAASGPAEGAWVRSHSGPAALLAAPGGCVLRGEDAASLSCSFTTRPCAQAGLASVVVSETEDRVTLDFEEAAPGGSFPAPPCGVAGGEFVRSSMCRDRIVSLECDLSGSVSMSLRVDDGGRIRFASWCPDGSCAAVRVDGVAWGL